LFCEKTPPVAAAGSHFDCFHTRLARPQLAIGRDRDGLDAMDLTRKFDWYSRSRIFDTRLAIQVRGGGMRWSDRIGKRLKALDLHVFLTVAERGNMAKAVEQLAISRAPWFRRRSLT
jgi:hypothetical protein